MHGPEIPGDQPDTKTLALLTLAQNWLDMTPDERTNALAEGLLFANPVICRVSLYDSAVADWATVDQAAVLADWREHGLLVVTDNPGAERNRLRAPVVMVNRAQRRKAARRKRG